MSAARTGTLTAVATASLLSACAPAHRPTLPAWQRAARIETHAAPVLLRRRHTLGQRYAGCFVSRLSFEDVRTRSADLRRAFAEQLRGEFHMAWLEAIDALPGPRAVDVRQVGFAFDLELSAGGEHGEARFAFPVAGRPVQLTDLNARVSPTPSGRWRDGEHDAGTFGFAFHSSELLDGAFPEAAVAPGASWTREVVRRSRDTSTAWTDEYRATQRYDVTGIERAVDGAWVHLALSGPLVQQTRSGVLRADVRGAVAGGARLSLRDGHTGRWWYEQRGAFAGVWVGAGERHELGATVVLRTEGAVVEVGATWRETSPAARALLRPCAPRALESDPRLAVPGEAT